MPGSSATYHPRVAEVAIDRGEAKVKIWGRPTPADVRSRSILDLLFTLGAVAALVVAIARALLMPAAATHPTWDSRHLGSVHISTDDEDL